MSANDIPAVSWLKKAKKIGGKVLDFTPIGVPYRITQGTLSESANPIVAEQGKMWFGDKSKLSEIDKAIAESEQSPYNEMKASKISVGDELKDYYNRMRSEYGRALYDYRNPTGMAPAEFAASQTRFNQAQNQQQMTAQMAGGGGAGAYIGSVLGNNAADFNLNLAAQNENIKRQNKQIAMSYLSSITGQLGQTAGAIQDIETKNTMLEQEAFAKNFEKQMLAEQALGQARQDWYYNRDQNRRAMVNAGTQILGTAVKAFGA